MLIVIFSGIILGAGFLTYTGYFDKVKYEKNRDVVLRKFGKDVEFLQTNTISNADYVVEIPSIKMKELMYNVKPPSKENFDNEKIIYEKALLNGLVPLRSKDQSLEFGRFTIAGHNTYLSGIQFNKLNDVKINDEILIKNRKNETYIYTVRNIYLLNNNLIDESTGLYHDVINDSYNKKNEVEHNITLQSCSISSWASPYKIFVTGEFKEKTTN